MNNQSNSTEVGPVDESKTDSVHENDNNAPVHPTPNNAGTSGTIKRQLWSTFTVLVILAVVGLFVVRSGHSENNDANAPAPSPSAPIAVSQIGRETVQIKTVPVKLESLDNKLQSTGLVSYPADQTVKISPRLQGRVRQVFVNVGDHIAVGQVLAILDSVDAATAQTTAMQAQNKLSLAKITLDRQQQLYKLGTPEVTSAEAALDQAKANTAFKKDALEKIKEQAKIGGFTQLPLASARTNVVQAQSALDSAKQDLDLAQRARDRSSKLNAIGLAASQDLEAADNTLAKAKVTVNADVEQLALAQETLVRERKAYRSNLYADQSVSSAQNDYQQALLQQVSAERALQLAKAAILTNYQQSQSDYQSALMDAENAHNALSILGQPTKDGLLQVKSPVSGILVERDVNPGETVDQSQMTPWQMFTISSTKVVWVEGDIYESDVAGVKLGQTVSVHVDAFPDRTFTGVVRQIAPTLDPKTRAIKIRANIPNSDGALKDGMFAEMTIDTGRSNVAPVVPMDAIQHDSDSDYVYVAEGNKYVRRNVTVGLQKNGECTVTTGLNPNEYVVSQGALFLGTQASTE